MCIVLGSDTHLDAQMCTLTLLSDCIEPDRSSTATSRSRLRFPSTGSNFGARSEAITYCFPENPALTCTFGQI